MTRRINIDALDLDLRGIDPAAAEAATRLLGPALQAAFAQPHVAVDTAAAGIDAGSIAPAGEPQALAMRLAQRIAASVSSRTEEN